MSPPTDQRATSFVIVDDDGTPQTTLPASRADTLWEVLTRAGVPFRSQCGGNSSCGTCWVQLVDAHLPPAADELLLLTLSGVRIPNPRLACRLSIPDTHHELRVRLVQKP